jgi:ubiquinone/menaquinone biosynthesis C-methylase UbiE
MSSIDSNAQAFNDDVERNGSYAYTTGGRLSSQMANEHLTEATLSLVDFRDQRVLDIGCGDGAYTVELYDRGAPAFVQGIEPAEAAIEAARKKVGSRKIDFSVGSAYDLPYESDSFDTAHLRGVLHHMDRPADALREAFRVAKSIVVIEPNGYSPVLKLIERVSRYHREHGEKSYSPHQLRHWAKNLGGEVTADRFVGVVPFFAPDAIARLLKIVEPPLETTPILRAVGCAVYAFVATRHERGVAA